MIFWHTFKESIKLPSKEALFKLNRIGMDIVVIYMFILLFLVSIPSFIQQIQTESYIYDLNILFQAIYFFVFYYLPLTVIVFLFLSLLAYIALGITKLMRRKLRFAILWKMSAFTTTIPAIIYTIITFFIPINMHFFWIFILYTVILLIKMISIYPKRRVRKNNK